MVVSNTGNRDPVKQALGRSVQDLAEAFLAYGVSRIEAACNAQRELLLRNVQLRGDAYLREVGLAQFTSKAFFDELARPFSLQQPLTLTIDMSRDVARKHPRCPMETEGETICVRIE
jgi:hypothetical protein